MGNFTGKPQIGDGWINGGFFVLEPDMLDYIETDENSWRAKPMEQFAREGELMAFRHEGFRQCMDAVRDLKLLASLWSSGKAPWKIGS
jgi:glucose-1-phosphate cytidylyltransferase